MIELSPQIHSPESPDPGKAQAPKDVKQNGLGVFAKLLAGLRGSGRMSDGLGSDGPGSDGPVPDGQGPALHDGAPGEAVSRKGKAGAAKKAASPDPSKHSLSAEHEKLQKKTIPEKAPPAAAEEDRALMAALQGPAPGEMPPEMPETGPAEEGLAPEGPGLSIAAGEDPAAGEVLPELSGGPFREAGDQVREDPSGEGRTRSLPKGRGSAPADPVDPAPAPAAEAGQGRLSRAVRPASPEAKDKGPVSESRNGKKDRERLSLELRDLRSGQEPAAVRGEQESRTAGEEAPGRGEAEFTVEFRPDGRSPGKPGPGGEGRSSQVFTDMLARELNQTLNGDIVRHASIMLRDGGAGTIRLSLKPESLGTVKIRLEMAENKIAGQIIVESDEALRAFERELRSLEQAFRDSGFEGASLEMALAGDGGQKGAAGQWKGEEARPFFSPRLAASRYDAAGETAGSEIPGFGGAPGRGPVLPQVNMLV